MPKAIVFTDIHFRPPFPEREINPATRLRDGLSHVIKYQQDADIVVITGDLTHNGDVESYELLKNVLAEFNLTYLLMVGNHDIRNNCLSVFTETKTDPAGYMQSSLVLGDHKLIFLDSLDGPPTDRPKRGKGYLCAQRLEWLDNELSMAPDKQCIIFMHHPPHKVGFVGMDGIRLENGDEFYDILKRHKNVAHISCGHIHRTISGSQHGIPFSVFKSTVGQMPMLFDSPLKSLETNEPPAYGIIDMHADGVTVHTEDYGLTDLDTYAD